MMSNAHPPHTSSCFIIHHNLPSLRPVTNRISHTTLRPIRHRPPLHTKHVATSNMQPPPLHILRTMTSKALTLIPLLPLPYTLLIRVIGLLFNAHPSESHPILGTLLRLVNPIYSFSFFLPAVPLLGALLLLIPPHDAVSKGGWGMLYPFLSSMFCQLLCVVASMAVGYEGINMNEGGVGKTLVFGQDMGHSYHALMILGFVAPATWMAAPVVFGILYVVRKVLFS